MKNWLTKLLNRPQQNVTVSYNDQAILNAQAFADLEPAYMGFFKHGYELIQQLVPAQIIANRLAEEQKMDPKASYSITFDPAFYQRNMDEYLKVQTESIYFISAHHMPRDILPAAFDTEKFNPKNVVIGKFKNNFYENSHNKTETEMQQILENLQSKVKEQEHEIGHEITAYFGCSLFD